MKKSVPFIILAFLLTVSTACGAPSALIKVVYPEKIAFGNGGWQAYRKQNEVSENFDAALTNFSITATEAVLSPDKSGNANFSPLSLYYTLAISQSGAKGETADEIAGLIAGGGLSPEEIAEQCGKLFRRLYNLNEHTTLTLANSVWSQVPIKEPFAKKTAESFYAESFEADFTDPKTADKIAGWIKSKLNGSISPKIELLPEQVLSIINTVYYADEWTDKFSASKTAEGIFHSPEKDEKIDFMNKTTLDGFRRGGSFTAAALSLKSGNILFVLPDEGVSPRELLADEGLTGLIEGGESKSGEILWSVPKFNFDSSFKLKEALQSLGINLCFTREADFSGISDNDPLYFAEVVQETHISIDERGVTASAYTNIQYYGAPAPIDRADMILDRPFLYIIRAGGVILFAGVVESVG